MKSRITVVIVDDHPVFRAGLIQVVSRDPDFEVVGEANNGAEALELIVSRQPKLAVVDIDMPKMGGLELAQVLVKRGIGTRLLVLTMHKSESFLAAAVDLGIQGYVLKDNAVLDILQSLRAVAHGDSYISPLMAHHLTRRAQKASQLLAQKPSISQLTAMERRILSLISENWTTREIAGKLFISPLTVETHRRNICQKLDLHGSHRLLQFALEHRGELLS